MAAYPCSVACTNYMSNFLHLSSAYLLWLQSVDTLDVPIPIRNILTSNNLRNSTGFTMLTLSYKITSSNASFFVCSLRTVSVYPTLYVSIDSLPRRSCIACIYAFWLVSFGVHRADRLSLHDMYSTQYLAKEHQSLSDNKIDSCQLYKNIQYI